jgi:GntR family transcriptional regulator
MAETVLREPHVPLYEQLRRVLLGEIRDQSLTAGSALASEADLGERFGVSRTVVRQALGELERQGHVTRHQGKGTFVSEPKLREHFLDRAGGLYNDLASRGHSVRSVVLACDEREADAATASALALAPASSVVVLDRVRHVDGEALVFTRSHLPKWLGPDLRDVLQAADLGQASLYALLESRYGVRVVEADRTIEAVPAERWVARLLGVKTAAASLRLRSIARDASGQPVEYFEAWHRGDRTLFELHVRGDPGTGSGSASPTVPR